MPDDTPPRYDGPRALAESLSALARASPPGAPWNREGLRDDSEYRDLGLAAATGGRLGVKHIRALKPMPAPTGWHWHDMTAHYVYVLRGSLTFRFAGVDGDVTLCEGDGLSQPAGVRTRSPCRTSSSGASSSGVGSLAAARWSRSGNFRTAVATPPSCGRRS